LREKAGEEQARHGKPAQTILDNVVVAGEMGCSVCGRQACVCVWQGGRCVEVWRGAAGTEA